MAVRKNKEESFNKKLVVKILEGKGETYDKWLEEKHREFLESEENKEYILRSLDTYKVVGGE